MFLLVIFSSVFWTYLILTKILSCWFYKTFFPYFHVSFIFWLLTNPYAYKFFHEMYVGIRHKKRIKD